MATTPNTEKDYSGELRRTVSKHFYRGLSVIILQSATFHTTYSVPGSFSLKRSHPDAMAVAMERSEVPCVVCARKDWLENRFTVYLWREADGSQTLTELRNVDSGTSKLLTCGSHLCFGTRDVINDFLATEKYCERMPLIPKDHLYVCLFSYPP